MTLKGYCKILPLSQRLYLLYQESNAKSQEIISRRVIFDKKINMSLSLAKIGEVENDSIEEDSLN